jgi:hypothetical protein
LESIRNGSSCTIPNDEDNMMDSVLDLASQAVTDPSTSLAQTPG